MTAAYELAKLREEVARLEAENVKLRAGATPQAKENDDWYDSGCTIDEDDQWEESARHWADEGDDWYSSNC